MDGREVGVRAVLERNGPPPGSCRFIYAGPALNVFDVDGVEVRVEYDSACDTPLYKYSVQGDAVQVAHLLSEGADPMEHRATAFLAACCLGFAEVVEVFLHDARFVFREENTADLAFRLAVTSGRLRVLDVLLRSPRIPLSDEPLLAAVSVGASAAMVDRILAEPSLSPSWLRDALSRSWDFCASAAALERIAADPRAGPSEELNDIFKLACEHQSTALIERLRADARVDPTYRRCAALVAAARNGDVSTVDCLLRDPRLDVKMCPHLPSVAAAQASVMELLLDGGRFNEHMLSSKQPLLHAFLRGDADMVGRLLGLPAAASACVRRHLTTVLQDVTRWRTGCGRYQEPYRDGDRSFGTGFELFEERDWHARDDRSTGGWSEDDDDVQPIMPSSWSAGHVAALDLLLRAMDDRGISTDRRASAWAKAMEAAFVHLLDRILAEQSATALLAFPSVRRAAVWVAVAHMRNDIADALLAHSLVAPHAAELQPLMLEAAACANNMPVLARLLADISLPVEEPNLGFHALCAAARSGCCEAVQLLLDDPRVAVNWDEAWAVTPGDSLSEFAHMGPISLAAGEGWLRIVEVALFHPRVDLSSDRLIVAKAVEAAQRHVNAIQILQLLLADPRVDPCADAHRAARLAAQCLYSDRKRSSIEEAGVLSEPSGFAAVLLCLLLDPRFDPSACDNALLHEAVTEGMLDDFATARRLLCEGAVLRCTMPTREIQWIGFAAEERIAPVAATVAWVRRRAVVLARISAFADSE